MHIKNYILKIASELGAVSNKEIFLSEYNKALEENTIKFKFPQKSFIESFGFNYSDILFLYIFSGSYSTNDFKDKLNDEIKNGHLNKTYLNKNIKELVQDLYTKIFNLVNAISITENLSKSIVFFRDLFFFYYLLNKCIFLLSIFKEKDGWQKSSNKILNKDKDIIIEKIINNDNTINLAFPNLLKDIYQYKKDYGYDDIININDLYNFYLASNNKGANYEQAFNFLYECNVLFGLIFSGINITGFNIIMNIIKNIDFKSEDKIEKFLQLIDKLSHHAPTFFKKDDIIYVLDEFNSFFNKLSNNNLDIMKDIIKKNVFYNYLDESRFVNLYSIF